LRKSDLAYDQLMKFGGGVVTSLVVVLEYFDFDSNLPFFLFCCYYWRIALRNTNGDQCAVLWGLCVCTAKHSEPDFQRYL